MIEEINIHFEHGKVSICIILRMLTYKITIK